MGFFAFKENKSLGETMSKEEIEERLTGVNNDIEDLRDSVDIKERELRNYADDIPVIDIWEEPENTDILVIVSQNFTQNNNRECLIINHTNKSITFYSDVYFDLTELGRTKTFFYKQDFTKKTITGTVVAFGTISAHVIFNNVLSISAGSNVLFKYIATV